MKVRLNMEFKFVISLVFAILVAIFAIQNSGVVEIRFFFTDLAISQAVVILASSIIGAIIVFLLSLINRIKQNLKIKELSKEVEMLIREKEELKKLVTQKEEESLEGLEEEDHTVDIQGQNEEGQFKEE